MTSFRLNICLYPYFEFLLTWRGHFRGFTYSAEKSFQDSGRSFRQLLTQTRGSAFLSVCILFRRSDFLVLREFYGEDVAVDPMEDGERFGRGEREESGMFGVELLDFGGGEFAADRAAGADATSPRFASEGNRFIVDEEAGDVKIFADPRGTGRYVSAQVRGGPIGIVFEDEIFGLLRNGVSARKPCEVARHEPAVWREQPLRFGDDAVAVKVEPALRCGDHVERMMGQTGLLG